MVPFRYRIPRYSRGIANLCAALDLLWCPYYYVQRGIGNHPVPHNVTVQSHFPAGNDSTRRDTRMARVEANTGLTPVDLEQRISD